MADTYLVSEESISPSSVLHPLEPLTAKEITAAIHIVRAERNLSKRVRFASVRLHEPPKEVVLNLKQNDPITREAFIILLDNTDGATYEAVVSITEGKVISQSLASSSVQASPRNTCGSLHTRLRNATPLVITRTSMPGEQGYLPGQKPTVPWRILMSCSGIR